MVLLGKPAPSLQKLNLFVEQVKFLKIAFNLLARNRKFLKNHQRDRRGIVRDKIPHIALVRKPRD